MPSRDVVRLMQTVLMPSGRLFVTEATEFCRDHTDFGSRAFELGFYERFKDEIETLKRRLDMPDVTLSRVLGLILTTIGGAGEIAAKEV